MSRKSFKLILLALALVTSLAALPASAAKPHGFTGFCSCGCSFTPDCNTSADCFGGTCLKAPTCCLAAS